MVGCNGPCSQGRIPCPTPGLCLTHVSEQPPACGRARPREPACGRARPPSVGKVIIALLVLWVASIALFATVVRF